MTCNYDGAGTPNSLHASIAAGGNITAHWNNFMPNTWWALGPSEFQQLSPLEDFTSWLLYWIGRTLGTMPMGHYSRIWLPALEIHVQVGMRQVLCGLRLIKLAWCQTQQTYVGHGGREILCSAVEMTPPGIQWRFHGTWRPEIICSGQN